jgi:NAD(P)-dependent dehydrogenase (short-subunit alcohol dehydrogenase family)
MSKTVWLITGAGRGTGTDIAKAALAAGHAVVATGRDPERVAAVIGAHDDLLAVKLEIASLDEPPVRWVAGADAVQTVASKGRDLIAQANAYRDLSSSLAHED